MFKGLAKRYMAFLEGLKANARKSSNAREAPILQRLDNLRRVHAAQQVRRQETPDSRPEEFSPELVTVLAEFDQMTGEIVERARRGELTLAQIRKLKAMLDTDFRGL